ncbi:MAG: hypothetical protein HPM95_01305 [Alphaproteobacteria bacterium]|nr:hypothetical protein [Alphaproteobacteria bacterium]
MTSTYLSPAREELAHRIAAGVQFRDLAQWHSRLARDPAAWLLSPVEVVDGVARLLLLRSLIGLAPLGDRRRPGLHARLLFRLRRNATPGRTRHPPDASLQGAENAPCQSCWGGSDDTVLRTPFRENQKPISCTTGRRALKTTRMSCSCATRAGLEEVAAACAAGSS